MFPQMRPQAVPLPFRLFTQPFSIPRSNLSWLKPFRPTCPPITPSIRSPTSTIWFSNSRYLLTPLPPSSISFVPQDCKLDGSTPNSQIRTPAFPKASSLPLPSLLLTIPVSTMVSATVLAHMVSAAEEALSIGQQVLGRVPTPGNHSLRQVSIPSPIL